MNLVWLVALSRSEESLITALCDITHFWFQELRMLPNNFRNVQQETKMWLLENLIVKCACLVFVWHSSTLSWAMSFLFFSNAICCSSKTNRWWRPGAEEGEVVLSSLVTCVSIVRFLSASSSARKTDTRLCDTTAQRCSPVNQNMYNWVFFCKPQTRPDTQREVCLAGRLPHVLLFVLALTQARLP